MKLNDLRVWWSNNFGNFHINVKSVDEAKIVLNTLTQYDLHLGSFVVWNAGGLEICEVNADNPVELTWYEWYNEFGEDIRDVMREEEDEHAGT